MPFPNKTNLNKARRSEKFTLHHQNFIKITKPPNFTKPPKFNKTLISKFTKINQNQQQKTQIQHKLNHKQHSIDNTKQQLNQKP